MKDEITETRNRIYAAQMAQVTDRNVVAQEMSRLREIDESL